MFKNRYKRIHFCHDLPAVMQLFDDFDLNNLTSGEDGSLIWLINFIN